MHNMNELNATELCHGGERVWGLQQGRDSGLRLGEPTRPADWIERIFTDTGCQCLPLSLSLTHTPFHELPYTSLFHAPLQLLPRPRPSLRFLVLAAPLHGSSSYTENHPFTLRSLAHPHCCPRHTRACNTHTHTPTAWGHSSCTLSHSHSASLSPRSRAHLHTHTRIQRATHPRAHSPALTQLPRTGSPPGCQPILWPQLPQPLPALSHICVNARRHTHSHMEAWSCPPMHTSHNPGV